MEPSDKQQREAVNANDPMKKAEEVDPIVKEASNAEAPIPNRDSDEFTDQHLDEPDVDTQAEKVTEEIEEK